MYVCINYYIIHKLCEFLSNFNVVYLIINYLKYFKFRERRSLNDHKTEIYFNL